MKIVTTTVTTHTLATGPGVDDDVFPLYFRPTEGVDPLVTVSSDRKRAVVSYLVDDEDPRYGSIREFLTDEHFGGEDPDDNWIEFANGAERNQWICDRLGTCAECGLPRSDHDDEVRDGAESGGYDRACDEFRPVVAWTDRMFWVERYEHGEVRYGLIGESSRVDRQWDVAGGVAIITIPEDWGGEPADAARSVLESLTAWCNGWVYGVVHEFFHADPGTGWTADTDEACGGYVGSENALSVLGDEHAHYAGGLS